MRFTFAPSMPRAARLLACALLALPALVNAGPLTGFKDSWMVMGEASELNQDWMINRAFTGKDALGVGYHRWKMDGSPHRVEHTGVNYVRRVARWNRPDSQANLWFALDVGTTRETHPSGHRMADRTGWMPMVQFDWETTRLYTLVSAATLRGKGGLQYDTYKAQAGFSFYEVNFDEWQPWLVVEAKRMPRFDDKVEVTPFLRFILKSLYVEVGANTEGKPRVAVMKVFAF